MTMKQEDWKKLALYMISEFERINETGETDNDLLDAFIWSRDDLELLKDIPSIEEELEQIDALKEQDIREVFKHLLP